MPCAAGLGCLTLLAKVEDNLLNDISKERNVEEMWKVWRDVSLLRGVFLKNNCS